MLRLLSIIQHFSILYNVIGRHRSSGILTQQHDCIDFILDENVGALAENIGVLFDPRTSNYFAVIIPGLLISSALYYYTRYIIVHMCCV